MNTVLFVNATIGFSENLFLIQLVFQILVITLREYIVALIHLYNTVVLRTWIFNNTCKTLSYALTYVFKKQKLNKLLFDA